MNDEVQRTWKTAKAYSEVSLQANWPEFSSSETSYTIIFYLGIMKANMDTLKVFIINDVINIV
jgi:hypothetical protein